MSTSSPRRLRVVNDNCALRRNLKTQPYGRCSVCRLKLRQCHAWQSSGISFVLVILLLVALVAGGGWLLKLAIGLSVGLVVVIGIVQHRRTDELIFGQHELLAATELLRERNAAITAASDLLEGQVASRTARLRETNVALARANLTLAIDAEEKESFMLRVSHDLRTPLTSIKGATQNLLDGIAGELKGAQREYVEIVGQHAERMIGAVGSLLSAVRAQRPAVRLEPAIVDVAALARDVAASLAPIAEQRRIQLSVEGAAVDVRADPTKLRTVLENLVGNALKFTREEGRVGIEVSCVGGRPAVTVTDDGVGIEEVDLERIFDLGYRANEDGAGSGFGLAIARDLVRLHGGDIAVSSAPGRGSRFVVELTPP